MKKQFSVIVCLFAGGLMLSGSARIAHAQRDSVTPSNEIATGHSYVGIDLGITGSDYLGGHNFLWGIVTSIDPGYHIPDFATYLPFTNLGTGIGAVAGAKVGLALSASFDLEAKFRFLTNYTTQTESHTIQLDSFVPSAVANATSSYSLLLSSLDFAVLGHLRISDYYYATAGFSASQLMKNGFSASQHLTSGGYVDLINHAKTYLVDQSQPNEQVNNWFSATRFDAQVGLGSVYRLGASNILLDAELLVSIPFTQWLTNVADSNLNATAGKWLQPAITNPHLWYATLTVGLRLPFKKLPPPVPEPVPPPTTLQLQSVQVSSAAPVLEPNGKILLAGKVTEASSGKPLAATLTTVDLSNNKVIDTAHTEPNGTYSVSVTGHPGKYSVTADVPGYLFGTAYYEVDSEGRVLYNPQHISLSNAANGKTRLLVFFEFDKADLQPASTPELNRAVDLMMNVPTMKVEIAGYSDSIGALQHNLDLSLRRANAVRDFLIQHGIAPGRITAHGYGPASPIAANASDEGRAENRRVEFVVKGE